MEKEKERRKEKGDRRRNEEKRKKRKKGERFNGLGVLKDLLVPLKIVSGVIQTTVNTLIKRWQFPSIS